MTFKDMFLEHCIIGLSSFLKLYKIDVENEYLDEMYIFYLPNSLSEMS